MVFSYHLEILNNFTLKLVFCKQSPREPWGMSWVGTWNCSPCVTTPPTTSRLPRVSHLDSHSVAPSLHPPGNHGRPPPQGPGCVRGDQAPYGPTLPRAAQRVTRGPLEVAHSRPGYGSHSGRRATLAAGRAHARTCQVLGQVQGAWQGQHAPSPKSEGAGHSIRNINCRGMWEERPQNKQK